ncbi:MAG: TfuA-like protein [Polyangiales bacterium]
MSATAIVFLGPSLPAAEARGLFDASYRPPAAQGDVYRAALERPWGIGIIDGYFERVPAVWHKEILWALSQGIHVFGAASMGALRAVELAPFGMIGAGAVVKAFRSGLLTDDDEVAILHAEAEHDYRPLSEALVDMRATLTAADKAGVITADTAAALVSLAKGMHYTERSYQRLLQLATKALEPRRAELERLATWLPEQRVRQKQHDARELLALMARTHAEQPGPKRVDFHFEHTDAFERAMQRAAPPTAASRSSALGKSVLEELRLDRGAYGAHADRSLARVLARDVAERERIEVDPVAYREAVTDFRRARGLLETVDVCGWLERRGMDSAELGEQLRDELRVRALRKLLGGELEAQLLGSVRAFGDYERLAQRARTKAELLQRHGYAEPTLADTGLTEPELWAWHYGEQAEPNALLAELDCVEPYAFLRALVREHLYRRLTTGQLPARTLPGTGPVERERS